MEEAQIPQFTLGQLKQITSGKIFGDENLTLKGFSSDPLKATKEQLCFAFTPKYIKLLNEGKLNAGAYLVPEDSKVEVEVPRVAVKRPKLTIKLLLDLFAPKRFSFNPSVHPSVVKHENVQLGKNVKIGPNVFLGPNCKIGDNTEIQAGVVIGRNVEIEQGCLLKANVVIEDYCKIGKRVIIHPNTVIGADGFSYVTEDISNLEKARAGAKPEELSTGRQIQHKVPSAGIVIIEEDVEIGANTCIDRGTMGPTIIKKGTKIDNLVQIAHNCTIGEDCLLVGQCGIAGSVTLGDRVVVAGHAGCKDNTEIGHDTIIAGASHTHKDAPPYSIMGGDPAIPATEWIKKEKALRKAMREAPKLREELNELKKIVAELQK
ncbi:MAG TPA: UDP-3-O-(3-hydroxymyristoyl)glucosamine N-acyltransferase, partial [Vampirovibrionales bacterium]